MHRRARKRIRYLPAPSQRRIAPIKYIYIYICNNNEADVNCVRADERATESRAICIGRSIKVPCEHSATSSATNGGMESAGVSDTI